MLVGARLFVESTQERQWRLAGLMPAKQIRIGSHADFEMRRRGIRHADVTRIIRSPGQVLPSRKGRQIQRSGSNHGRARRQSLVYGGANRGQQDWPNHAVGRDQGVPVAVTQERGAWYRDQSHWNHGRPRCQFVVHGQRACRHAKTATGF